MEYIGNEKYWDDKFVNRENKPLNPEKSIVENISYFKKGSVLDIACGDGRNTLFFLENSFEVTGVDFSSKGLERLETFAQKSNYLASQQFLHQWQERNHLHDQSIVREISQLGFLTDMQRSHRVADWAYKQAIENEYLVWLGAKDKQIFRSIGL